MDIGIINTGFQRWVRRKYAFVPLQRRGFPALFYLVHRYKPGKSITILQQLLSRVYDFHFQFYVKFNLFFPGFNLHVPSTLPARQGNLEEIRYFFALYLHLLEGETTPLQGSPGTGGIPGGAGFPRPYFDLSPAYMLSHRHSRAFPYSIRAGTVPASPQYADTHRQTFTHLYPYTPQYPPASYRHTHRYEYPYPYLYPTSTQVRDREIGESVVSAVLERRYSRYARYTRTHHFSTAPAAIPDKWSLYPARIDTRFGMGRRDFFHADTSMQTFTHLSPYTTQYQPPSYRHTYTHAYPYSYSDTFPTSTQVRDREIGESVVSAVLERRYSRYARYTRTRPFSTAPVTILDKWSLYPARIDHRFGMGRRDFFHADTSRHMFTHLSPYTTRYPPPSYRHTHTHAYPYSYSDTYPTSTQVRDRATRESAAPAVLERKYSRHDRHSRAHHFSTAPAAIPDKWSLYPARIDHRFGMGRRDFFHADTSMQTFTHLHLYTPQYPPPSYRHTHTHEYPYSYSDTYPTSTQVRDRATRESVVSAVLERRYSRYARYTRTHPFFTAPAAILDKWSLYPVHIDPRIGMGMRDFFHADTHMQTFRHLFPYTPQYPPASYRHTHRYEYPYTCPTSRQVRDRVEQAGYACLRSPSGWRGAQGATRFETRFQAPVHLSMRNFSRMTTLHQPTTAAPTTTPTLDYFNPAGLTQRELKTCLKEMGDKSVPPMGQEMEKVAAKKIPSSRGTDGPGILGVSRQHQANINLNLLTDQVYQMLETRLRMERERRGW